MMKNIWIDTNDNDPLPSVANDGDECFHPAPFDACNHAQSHYRYVYTAKLGVWKHDGKGRYCVNVQATQTERK
jgi:hypothetical protein